MVSPKGWNSRVVDAQMTMRCKINIPKSKTIRRGMHILLSIRFSKTLKYSVLIAILTMPLCKAVNADSTRVFLDPSSQTVGAIGDSFNVNVSIANVSNLYGYQLTIYYNSTVMNATQVAEGSLLKSGGQTFFLHSFVYHYNSTHGAVEITGTLLGNVSGIGGSGVLASIEFKSLVATDSTSLHLAGVNLASSPPTPSLIPHEDSDGTVIVVPEFASLIACLALIAASLLSILVKKGARHEAQHCNS
jgi:hypothetical protein